MPLWLNNCKGISLGTEFTILEYGAYTVDENKREEENVKKRKQKKEEKIRLFLIDYESNHDFSIQLSAIGVLHTLTDAEGMT